jgi:hypothetical protein
LLGTADAAEIEEVELRIIEEEIFANEMNLAETELIEDYLEGTLTAAEGELFEKYFLDSEERREHVQEIKLLKRYSSGPHRFALEVAEPVAKPWFSGWFRVLVPVFGVLVVGVLGYFIWQNLSSGSSLEAEYAALNRKNFSDPSIIGDAQVVQVFPSTFRDTSAGGVTVITGGSGAVLFRLPLSFQVAERATFRVELLHGGARAFAVDDVRAYTTEGGKEVRVLMPRSEMPAGSYQIKLWQQESKNAPVVYNFEVR